MLDKYEDFIKLSVCGNCSIYEAYDKKSCSEVLIKRISDSTLTWNYILKNGNVFFKNKAKLFPKMLQLFKHKDDFYTVYERPAGPSLR